MDQKKRKEIYDRAQIMGLEDALHWLYWAGTIAFTRTGLGGAWMDRA